MGRRDYEKLAAEAGISWVGPRLPPDTMHKTIWRCRFGHEWQAEYRKIKDGTRCPWCAGKARRTDADYHRLARRLGWNWIGPNPGSIARVTEWQTPSGRLLLSYNAAHRRATSGAAQ
jgi:hypothetical protein